MQLIVFSKFFKDKSIAELIELAREYGFEGYDLCVRPGYPVNPDNAAEALPGAVRAMEAAGLSIPMVTGNFDLLTPDHPTAEPLLAAMDKAGVRLLKLGYFSFDPHKQGYWSEVDRIRRAFEGWQTLAQRHTIKVCYHTHSHRCMGLNCSSLAHLLIGFDPQYIGAYIDPGHMTVEGEEFAVGAAIVNHYLSIVALKDVLLERQPVNGHGKAAARWVPAGEGMVDWTAVFAELRRLKFAGPLSVHCEFEAPAEAFMALVRREFAFFKHMRNSAATNMESVR
jgi:sugar phosphate isomerase/epimerase